MAKRARKTKNQQHQGDVIQLNAFRSRERQVTMIPKNLRQEDYIELLDNLNKHIVFAMGPAGTGKTLLGVLAAIKDLRQGKCEKIIVTRPAVSVDEQHGYLPGTLVEKMAPWTRPIFDVFEEYWTPQQIELMIADGVIEIAPLAYMRGRTFKHAWIIADEMQNATPSQMKMLLTRLGEGSKMAVTGDLNQADRMKDNGLIDFINQLTRFGNSTHLDYVTFDHQDIERHNAVKEVLEVYGDE